MDTRPSCRICGAPRDDGRFTAHGFAWLSCERCGSIQKVLTPEQYRGLSPTYDPGTYLDGASRAEVEAFIQLDEAKRVIATVLARYHKAPLPEQGGRRFLDVGCGMGANLLAAQQLGFEVLGFEPSADHARVTLKHLQLPVIGDYFSKDKVGAMRFDLIMLSHVIEHIYAPAVFLRELISILKPGGVLLVVTPNTNSLVARLTGASWPMLKPVDHVSMISAKTYRFFGLDGLAQLHHWDSEYPYEFAATLASVLRSRRRRAQVPEALPGAASTPPVLKAVSLRTRCLKAALTVASAPAWSLAAATNRRACLNTALVRL